MNGHRYQKWIGDVKNWEHCGRLITCMIFNFRRRTIVMRVNFGKVHREPFLRGLWWVRWSICGEPDFRSVTKSEERYRTKMSRMIFFKYLLVSGMNVKPSGGRSGERYAVGSSKRAFIVTVERNLCSTSSKLGQPMDNSKNLDVLLGYDTVSFRIGRVDRLRYRSRCTQCYRFWSKLAEKARARTGTIPKRRGTVPRSIIHISGGFRFLTNLYWYFLLYVKYSSINSSVSAYLPSWSRFASSSTIVDRRVIGHPERTSQPLKKSALQQNPLFLRFCFTSILFIWDHLPASSLLRFGISHVKATTSERSWTESTVVYPTDEIVNLTYTSIKPSGSVFPDGLSSHRGCEKVRLCRRFLRYSILVADVHFWIPPISGPSNNHRRMIVDRTFSKSIGGSRQKLS